MGVAALPLGQIMARPSTPTSKQPDEQPSTTPRDLYPISDIRFVMTELGKLSTQVERLISDVRDQGSKLDDVRLKISFVNGAMWVIGGILVTFGAIFIWFLKGKLG